jgi:hypothetical protein
MFTMLKACAKQFKDAHSLLAVLDPNQFFVSHVPALPAASAFMSATNN